MKCPRDGTELSSVQVGAITLDKCNTCDGLWCDRGELKAIREAKLTDVERQIEEAYGNPEVKQAELDGHMQCPRCEGRLNGVFYAIHQPMRVDRCDTCLGYWLDAGELDLALGQPKHEDETQESRVKMVLRSVSQWLS